VKIKKWLKLGGDTPIAEDGLVGKFTVAENSVRAGTIFSYILRFLAQSSNGI
jgi:hypothetical protein